MRETPREDYFYWLGRLEMASEAGAHTLVGAYKSVVRNAEEQVRGA
jgi:hypothetical protein